ncbi:MAG: CPBP family intramembrane metalloprotease, partial [Clostridia bacterium]|nr:CPBP family intramembrane metalloprotease [Clostridia bacterium]
MQQTMRQPNGTFFGEPTPASSAGGAFSIAAVLPVLFSAIFLIAVGQIDYTKTEWGLYIAYILPQLAFAVTAIWYARQTKTPLKTAIRAQKCKPKYFLLALLLQIGLLSLSELNALFLELLGNFGYEDKGILLPSMNGFGFFGVLFVVAVLPAVLEELMFRGVVLGGLKSFGELGSAVLCGALFALYHQNPAQTLYQFCCGFAFALVALRAGSILPTVFSHFFNNALILGLTKAGIGAFPAPVALAVFGVSLLCLVLSLVWLFHFDKK